MAESGPFHDQRSDNSYRGRGYQQSRPHFRGRGRGRGRGDNVQRALFELGVSDLRQHLDRKHQQDQARGGPPSDPSYSFLKDPARDDYDDYIDRQSRGSNLQRSHSYSSRRGRGKPKNEEHSFIQNPMNIRVEFSTSTGRRNYSVKQDSTLPNIKHIPDYQLENYHDTRPRGSRSVRARGITRHNSEFSGVQGQYRAKSTERHHEGRYESRGSQNRSKSVEGRGETSSERGRGGGSIRPRGVYRGRARESRYPEGDNKRGSEYRVRGRSRSRGRGNRRGRGGQKQSTEPQFVNNEVACEESWDDIAPSSEKNEERQLGGQIFEDAEEHLYKDESTEEEQYADDNTEEQQYGDDTKADKDEEQQFEDENTEEEPINNENTEEQQFEGHENPEEQKTRPVKENLVVTSSVGGKTKQRSVRFSLNEDDNDDDDGDEGNDENTDNKGVKKNEKQKG